MKKICNGIIMVALVYICFAILYDRESIFSSVKFSLDIWRNNIFPSLFPFFILSSIMINYGFVEILGSLIGPIMNKLFKVSSKSAFIFVMSIFSGNPSNAKYIKELYQNKEIDEREATKILCFSCFANPLFILGTVSIFFLNNKKVGLIILLCHYLGNIIVGLIIRNFYPCKDYKHITLKESIHNKRKVKPFGIMITETIMGSLNTLLLILGVMTMFLILTTIIDNVINIYPIYQSTLNGFIEMTQGLKYISLENIPLKIKCTLSVIILSFGGLSVHMQIMSILSDTNIKYFPFFCARVMHAFISGILIYIIFDYWFLLF